MTEKIVHPTDEELLLVADGEIDSRQMSHVRQHLDSCGECRARMHDIEASIRNFIHLHRATLNARIPAAEGPRRLLLAQLSELANQPSQGIGRQRWGFGFSTAKIASAAAVLLVAGFIAGMAWRHRLPWQRPADAYSIRNSSLPDRNLTPGSYLPVRLEDVCDAKSYVQARVTSVALKQEVLREYGMSEAAESDHEIDFLVIPELGGTEDIRNLWPEPYSSTVWNAHVKDELEERLHQLVCERKIDLATAQDAISTDWISAYKKYFHTDQPLSMNASL